MNRQARIDRLVQATSPPRKEVSPIARLGQPQVPDIITFVTSRQYLNRPNLYPNQALLLKVIFLAVELLTGRDREVLTRWGSGFTLCGEPGARRYEGAAGIQPDVVERMLACRAMGRRWFRESVLVLGRRGSKGYLTAICTAYIIWCYLALDDPQGHYGIESTKRLTGMVFAGDHSQAAGNLFRDIVRLITDAPCFAPYLAGSTKHALYLCTPQDLRRHQRVAADLVADASIVIDARPTTAAAGRGPAAFLALFDEYAHVGVDTARSGDEVYEGAVPALDQFGVDGFIVQASSPGNQLGKFYSSHRAALALDDDDTAADPTLLTVQLPSWVPYEDWELTAAPEGLEMVPGGPKFKVVTKPIVVYDDAMRRAEAANPTVFAVERRAQWRSSMDAFLAPQVVAAMFDLYNGAELIQQNWGALGTDYVMHVDPAKNHANYAIVVGHVGHHDDLGLPHVVIDAIHVRSPADYPDGQIDQIECYELTQQLIATFNPVIVTFDQYRSALTIERLQDWVATLKLPKPTQIYEVTATAPHNQRIANIFKSAAQLGLLHLPNNDLARQELTYLQERNGRVDHPSFGPVTTSDITDGLFEITNHLIGGDIDRWKQLGSLPLGMSQPGGFAPSTGPTPGFPDMSPNQYSAEFSAAQRPRYPGNPRTNRNQTRPLFGRRPNP